MKRVVLFLWLIAAVFCQGETDDIDEEEDEDDVLDMELPEVEIENNVYALTPENFDGFIDSQELVMVEFYAPWCGHCKQLAPEYDMAALELKKADSIGVLAKIDANEHPSIGSRYGVKGFPTLKIFKKGAEEPIDYEGGRTTFDIVHKIKDLSDPNWAPPASEVIELTTADFDEFVNKQPIMLVEFFAPWCGHCKKLKPEYEKAAQSLKMHSIPLATVDATVEPDIAKRFDVTGYPTLKIFRNGKVSEFKGGRTEKDIVNTMVTEKDPHCVEMLTADHKKQVDKPDTVRVLAIFPGLDKNSPEYELFEELTNDFRSSYPASYTFDQTIAKKYKVSAPTIVVLYPAMYVAKKEQGYKMTEIGQDSIISDLAEFIRANDKPLVGDYDCPNCKQYYDSVDTVRIYTSKDFGKGYDKNTKYWQEKTAVVARKMKGKGVHFVMCDETSQTEDLKAMKILDLGVETVFGIKTAKGDKYSLDSDEMDDMDDFEESLTDFVQQYLKGKLKVRRKSAPVPKKQTTPVLTVVGDNFEKVVEDPTRDVLIEFYAPWCGHCKSLEPKYNKLAKKLKSDKNVVIAKIDATANEYPSSYDVSGFPTIFMVPAGGNKTPIPYSGEREIEGLESFLKENAVTGFQGAKIIRDSKDEL